VADQQMRYRVVAFNAGGEALFELWSLSPDGEGGWNQEQLTNIDGANLLAKWGQLRVRAE
jgi:hypothetical protein